VRGNQHHRKEEVHLFANARRDDGKQYWQPKPKTSAGSNRRGNAKKKDRLGGEKKDELVESKENTVMLQIRRQPRQAPDRSGWRESTKGKKVNREEGYLHAKLKGEKDYLRGNE